LANPTKRMGGNSSVGGVAFDTKQLLELKSFLKAFPNDVLTILPFRCTYSPDCLCVLPNGIDKVEIGRDVVPEFNRGSSQGVS